MSTPPDPSANAEITDDLSDGVAGAPALVKAASNVPTRYIEDPHELLGGNAVRLLRNGAETFPAWLEAIASARRYVYFETYIFRSDRTGQQFVETLCERARAGVKVRFLYDWVGSFGTSSRMWRTLHEAGVEVRSFNPFDWSSPLGWVHRDHRKTVSVDGRVAFVSGLCVATPGRGIR